MEKHCWIYIYTHTMTYVSPPVVQIIDGCHILCRKESTFFVAQQYIWTRLIKKIICVHKWRKNILRIYTIVYTSLRIYSLLMTWVSSATLVWCTRRDLPCLHPCRSHSVCNHRTRRPRRTCCGSWSRRCLPWCTWPSPLPVSRAQWTRTQPGRTRCCSPGRLPPSQSYSIYS